LQVAEKVVNVWHPLCNLKGVLFVIVALQVARNIASCNMAFTIFVNFPRAHVELDGRVLKGLWGRDCNSPQPGQQLCIQDGGLQEEFSSFLGSLRFPHYSHLQSGERLAD